jgi:hypothetical protein
LRAVRRPLRFIAERGELALCPSPRRNDKQSAARAIRSEHNRVPVGRP